MLRFAIGNGSDVWLKFMTIRRGGGGCRTNGVDWLRLPRNRWIRVRQRIFWVSWTSCFKSPIKARAKFANSLCGFWRLELVSIEARVYCKFTYFVNILDHSIATLNMYITKAVATYISYFWNIKVTCSCSRKHYQNWKLHSLKNYLVNEIRKVYVQKNLTMCVSTIYRR